MGIYRFHIDAEPSVRKLIVEKIRPFTEHDYTYTYGPMYADGPSAGQEHSVQKRIIEDDYPDDFSISLECTFLPDNTPIPFDPITFDRLHDECACNVSELIRNAGGKIPDTLTVESYWNNESVAQFVVGRETWYCASGNESVLAKDLMKDDNGKTKRASTLEPADGRKRPTVKKIAGEEINWLDWAEYDSILWSGEGKKCPFVTEDIIKRYDAWQEALGHFDTAGHGPMPHRTPEYIASLEKAIPADIRTVAQNLNCNTGFDENEHDVDENTAEHIDQRESIELNEERSDDEDQFGD